MEHKQREANQQMSVLRENQSIAENLIKKKKEANENRLAVAASNMYADNHTYSKVNGGKDSRVKLSRLIHPLSPDECDVYTDLVDSAENSVIAACINHNMTEDGMVEGFSFTCNGRETASCLPITRKMFYRTSMVE